MTSKLLEINDSWATAIYHLLLQAGHLVHRPASSCTYSLVRILDLMQGTIT
jgi:hypothetical protein